MSSPRRKLFREKRFSPDEQAVAIWVSHTLILVAVTVFMLASVHKRPATGFLVGEGIIFAVFAILVPTWDRPNELWRRLVPPRVGKEDHDPYDWRRLGFLVAFAVTFFVQFVALTPLLEQTGGPIDSPFIQLALAFAVFTQILANEIHTMLIGLFASVGYYWFMLAVYNFDTSAKTPSHWVFGAVTTLIVAITVGLAMLDRLDWERKMQANDGTP
ncbi:MAG: hypothetical protein ACTHLH_06790 [Solirubrobacterales bacterium]